MKMSGNKGFIIFIAIFFIVMGVVVFAVFQAWKKSVAYGRPEQRDQVEVIGKRIIEDSPDIDSGGTNTYIVAFRFSDGSVKELRVGLGATYSNEPRKVYDSLHEGDTGILIYRERKNTEEKYKNESLRWIGRYFISFEKDS